MWSFRDTSVLDRQAEENWSALLQSAGLPLAGWRLSRLARRDDPKTAGLTLRATHPEAGDFAYKFQLRPHAPEGFARHHALQQAAFDSFPHCDRFTVPRPVYVDAARQVSLMEYIDGPPVSEMMQAAGSPDAQLQLLARCGAWLNAYHGQQTEARPFRPAHTLKYYGTLKQKILTGETTVPARALFLRGIDTLSELAPDFAGRPTLAAVQHGDFHLRNLICRNDQIVGIDMSKDQIAPVGYDIAKILLDFTAVFRSGVPLPNDGIVHPETRAAFFEGYTRVGADDPGVAFLLHARILATLFTVPAAPEDRTGAKKRTLRRLRPIAVHAFDRD